MGRSCGTEPPVTWAGWVHLLTLKFWSSQGESSSFYTFRETLLDSPEQTQTEGKTTSTRRETQQRPARHKQVTMAVLCLQTPEL